MSRSGQKRARSGLRTNQAPANKRIVRDKRQTHATYDTRRVLGQRRVYDCGSLRVAATLPSSHNILIIIVVSMRCSGDKEGATERT